MFGARVAELPTSFAHVQMVNSLPYAKEKLARLPSLRGATPLGCLIGEVRIKYNIINL